MSDALVGPMLPGGNLLTDGGNTVTIHPLGSEGERQVQIGKPYTVAKSYTVSSQDVKNMITLAEPDDGMQLSRWITKANHVQADQQSEIARLQEELKIAKWLLGHMPLRPLAAIETNVASRKVRIASSLQNPLAVTETDTGRNSAPADVVRERVDAVISDLAQRKVADADRARLRGAVDKADRPLAGREGADQALGRALGRSVTIGLRTSVV